MEVDSSPAPALGVHPVFSAHSRIHSQDMFATLSNLVQWLCANRPGVLEAYGELGRLSGEFGPFGPFVRGWLKSSVFGGGLWARTSVCRGLGAFRVLGCQAGLGKSCWTFRVCGVCHALGFCGLLRVSGSSWFFGGEMSWGHLGGSLGGRLGGCLGSSSPPSSSSGTIGGKGNVSPVSPTAVGVVVTALLPPSRDGKGCYLGALRASPRGPIGNGPLQPEDPVPPRPSAHLPVG
eukprot:3175685-Pyramimonas_sp.AAC.1